MASGAEIVGGAAQGASLIPALIGRGQNKRLATGFYDPTGQKQTGYDPDAQYYGGYKGGLRDYNANLNYRRNEAENRQAFQANYGDANAARAASAQARMGMQGMADQMAARARGQVPAIAQMQADRQMQQAQAAQMAGAASARGAAGMALAQQNAANNVANAQSSISGQAQINAANERMQAEQNALGAYGAIRGGDQGQQGMDASQAQFQAQMQQANRNANDSRAMGYEQLEANANQAALQGRMQNQAILAGSHNSAEAQNQQTANQNAGSKGLIETIGDFFSDARAKVMLSDMGAKSLIPGGGGLNPMATANFGGSSGAVDIGGAGGITGEMVQKASTGLTGNSMMPVGGGGVVGGGGTPGGFPSDTRAKEAALIAKGRQQGMALARGGRGGPSMNEMLDDRQQQYGPRVDTAGLQEALAAQNAQDRADLDIDRQVAERRALDERNASDPAVGLDRIAQDRGLIRRGSRPSNENAQADAERGVAPGTTDDERSTPKPMEDGKPKPWWMALGDVGKSLNDAQFGGGGRMVSDERAKEAAYKAGQQDALTRLADQKNAEADSPALRGAAAALLGPGMAIPAAVDLARAHNLYNQRDDANAAANGVRIAREAEPASPRRLDIDHPRMVSGRNDPIAEANRSMEGSAYAYKPGMTPPDQAPGEVNVGPMAQNMEQSPVAGTAVKTDPGTGLKVIDRDKALKVVMSGVASLQKQQDKLRSMLSRGGKK